LRYCVFACCSLAHHLFLVFHSISESDLASSTPPSTEDVTGSVKYILLHHFDQQGVLYMSVRRFIETSSRNASSDPKIDWRSEWTVRPYLYKTDINGKVR
jgi:hypothetical protein